MSHHKTLTNNGHSQIIRYIKSNNIISIAELMLLIGSSPHGYYSNTEKFTNDFITASEYSNVFNTSVAYFIKQMCFNSKLENFKIIELGPGTGKLLKSVLDELIYANKKVMQKKDISIHIVEASNKMQSLQKKTLKNYMNNINWHGSLGEIDINEPIILIANEFFDALPSMQFVKIDNQLYERIVFLNSNETITFGAKKTKNCYSISDKSIMCMPNDSIIEKSPASESTASYIASKIKEFGGMALIMDYGYINNSYRDTLKFINNHKFIDITKETNLSNVDISIEVNFLALKKQIEKKIKCEICEQTTFLKNINYFQQNIQNKEAELILKKMKDSFKVLKIKNL